LTLINADGERRGRRQSEDHEHDRLQHGGVTEDQPGDIVGLDANSVKRGSRPPNGCVGHRRGTPSPARATSTAPTS
jgi:hypothetical protein